MRIVFDTNVLVSALLKPEGISDLSLAMARHGRVKSLLSPAIVDELRRVLLDKLKLDPSLVESFIDILVEHSDIVRPRRTVLVIKTDPADNRILECALEGKADAIVTGDQHLLVLKTFRNIQIMSVRDFFDAIHKD